ncbi:hypothetical protein LY78DRAFT_704481 [Colletotrichum sublineola]|uniref:Cell wall protein n=1 Tax=Colletotrichum sublineola TaxID=1173701 RepID=A0A066XMQ7_COLSU|nr:hypothetical protein LY78DRAFT_704481 [Colletotrichum sublineola]KDN68954.1 hypothetical protein CSUB01_11362 [Colletotrichum sublineola]
MRFSNYVASFLSVTLASARALPDLSNPLGSVTTASIPTGLVSTVSLPAVSIPTASTPLVPTTTASIPEVAVTSASLSVVPTDTATSSTPLVPLTSTTSIPVVSATNVASTDLPQVTQLLSRLKSIKDAIATVKSNIDTSGTQLDVVEISKNFGSNGIVNIAMNNALLQIQSLNVTATSDVNAASDGWPKRVVDALTEISQQYTVVLQLLKNKMGDLKSAALRDSERLKTEFDGDNWLQMICDGLTLTMGLVNQNYAALAKVLPDVFQNAVNSAGSGIKSALDDSINATASQGASTRRGL